ncbi:MAG: hypothetical protein AB1762_08090 [Gemmatimonadota bacterium]
MYNPFIVPVALFAFLSVAALAMTPIWRALGRRMEHRALGSDPMRGEINERMERMETALDAIAVQVERIAEGQRYTTKLLSDRAESRALAASQHDREV